MSEEFLQSFAEKLSGLGLVSLVVFGSEARGEALPDSDVDVLVIVRDYSPDLTKIVRRVAFETSLEVGRKISVEIYSMDDFRFMVEEKFPFALGVYSAYRVLFDSGFFKKQVKILEDMKQRGEIKRHSRSKVWVVE